MGVYHACPLTPYAGGCACVVILCSAAATQRISPVRTRTRMRRCDVALYYASCFVGGAPFPFNYRLLLPPANISIRQACHAWRHQVVDDRCASTDIYCIQRYIDLAELRFEAAFSFFILFRCRTGSPLRPVLRAILPILPSSHAKPLRYTTGLRYSPEPNYSQALCRTRAVHCWRHYRRQGRDNYRGLVAYGCSRVSA